MVILFDFWGVIGRQQTHADLVDMARLGGVPAIEFEGAYWGERAPYDAGDEPAEYWSRVARSLSVDWPSSTIDALCARDAESWMRVDEDMLCLVGRLAGSGTALALLSNAPRALKAHVTDVVGAHMNPLIFSCDVGVAKPDPDIFRLALDILACDGSDVVFVDDREENVRSALTVGLKGFVHESLDTTSSQLAALLQES